MSDTEFDPAKVLSDPIYGRSRSVDKRLAAQGKSEIPPETSLSSRELAEELATIYQRQDGHYQRTAAMAALIDAWVRVREAEAVEAEHIRCLRVVEEQIDSYTGPTGGWIDSPKEVFAEIALNMLHHVVEES